MAIHTLLDKNIELALIVHVKTIRSSITRRRKISINYESDLRLFMLRVYYACTSRLPPTNLAKVVPENCATQTSTIRKPNKHVRLTSQIRR